MLLEEYVDPCLERNYTGHFQPITLARFNRDGKKVVTSSLGECSTALNHNIIVCRHDIFNYQK